MPFTTLSRNRAEIPEQLQWDLSHIYPDFDAWKAAKALLVETSRRLRSFEGTLGDSPQALLGCFELTTDIGKLYARLSSYASSHADIDTRNAEYLAYQQEIGQIGTDIGAETAFIEPEILAIGPEKIAQYLAIEPRLEIYRHALDDLLRRRDHTGSAGEEKLIADAGLMTDSSGGIYTVFSNADFPFPTITLHDGTSVKLDKAAFALHRTTPYREDRRNVFSTYFSAVDTYRRTFGIALYSEVKKNLFHQRARKYSSCLESALHGPNIPVDVYHALVRNARASLPTLHRYLSLRKRLLGVDQLHYYDLYVPVVPEVDLTYSFEEAGEVILESLQPLGSAYTQVACRAFAERWMDVYPNEGKIGGAYSNGAVYDVHPYILLNYNGKYDDVSTVTHELGHTMHSYLSNTTQPYPTASYSIFVAEVASTFNEALLMEHLLKTVTDPRLRLSLFVNYLDGVRATLFRQTQFAEFELKIHELVEQGETLTGDTLSALYADITRAYYGHEAGVCTVDDEIKAEWASVPHFYYNFYVYQYATSLTASTALAEMVLSGDNEATHRYLRLLSAGGSDYPIALLRAAGVDMTGPEPFALMMRKMNRVMDEVERAAFGGPQSGITSGTSR
jgi:oligoendopeptidase F